MCVCACVCVHARVCMCACMCVLPKQIEKWVNFSSDLFLSKIIWRDYTYVHQNLLANSTDNLAVNIIDSQWSDNFCPCLGNSLKCLLGWKCVWSSMCWTKLFVNRDASASSIIIFWTGWFWYMRFLTENSHTARTTKIKTVHLYLWCGILERIQHIKCRQHFKSWKHCSERQAASIRGFHTEL